MATYAAWVVRHRRAVIAVVLLITGCLASASTRLYLEVDPDRLLPQEHPYMRAAQDVKRLFDAYNVVVVGLFPRDGVVFTPAFLAKLDEVTKRIARLPGVKPALLQSLASANTKYVAGTEERVELEPVMPSPPVDLAGAEEVRWRAFAEPALVGTLVTADGSAASLFVDFKLTPEMPGYGQIVAAVRAALAELDDGTFDYTLAGPVVVLAEVEIYGSRLLYYLPLALLVIGLIHYHAFRTLQALFLPLVTALLAVVWALGLMGLFRVPLDPYNTTTPILILAVGAGHAVQILKRFYEELDESGDVETAIVASLSRVGPVMIAAGLLASLSFLSLVTFRTATIRTFGLFTGAGIASALAIELTIIPAVRAMLPPPRRREREREAASHPWLEAFLDGSANAARHAPGGVIAAGLVLFAACLVSASRVEVNMSVKRLFAESAPIRRADARLNATFAGTNTLELLIEGDEEGALAEPAILQAIDGLERTLEREPQVGKAISYVDFLRTFHRAVNAGRADLSRLPETRALAAQYLFLYSLSGSAGTFDTLIDPARRSAVVRLLVHDDTTSLAEALIRRVEEEVARTFPSGYQVRFTGTLGSAVAATDAMVEGKLWNMAQIALITIGVASIVLRSLLGGLLVALPLAFAVAVNFGVMGLLGVRLDDATSAISAMAVGIGADYAIYLLFRLREELGRTADLEEALHRALVTSGKAILFVATAIAGYGMLGLTGFLFHLRLGGLVALAMLVSAGSTIVLLPAVVAFIKPRFLWTKVEVAEESQAVRAAAAR
jgi:hypothetical protein